MGRAVSRLRGHRGHVLAAVESWHRGWSPIRQRVPSSLHSDWAGFCLRPCSAAARGRSRRSLRLPQFGADDGQRAARVSGLPIRLLDTLGGCAAYVGGAKRPLGVFGQLGVLGLFTGLSALRLLVTRRGRRRARASLRTMPTKTSGRALHRPPTFWPGLALRS